MRKESIRLMPGLERDKRRLQRGTYAALAAAAVRQASPERRQRLADLEH